MSDSFLKFLLVVAVVLILMLIIFAVVIFLAFRRFQRFVSPNTAALQKQFDQFHTSNPAIGTEALIRKIIQQQSLKCGLVGAITGLGGFITFPIALPIDLVMSMQIQATMVQFIAVTYGQSPVNSAGLKLQTYLITSGSVEVTERTFNLIMKFILRLLGESLSILVPAIGAIIGFAVNYTITQATGQMALRWYAGKIQRS